MSDVSLLLFTLGIAALSTVLILPGGLWVAWWLSHRRGGWAGIAETVVTLPLVLPPTAVGLLLLEIFRRRGLLGSVLASGGIEVAFTWKAVVLATAVMSFPLLVRSARTAFEEVDPRLLDMARTLGHRRRSVFLRVVLPLSWRGILGGSMLAFCRALGEFGATILVAGNIPGRTQTLALAIFQRVETGRDSEAWGLVAVTVAVAFAVVWSAERIIRVRERRNA